MAAKKQQYVVSVEPGERGPRLDKFLTEEMGITRNQVKKLIEQELVLVNDAKPTVHKFLKNKDKVSVMTATEKKVTEKEMPKPDVIYEDDDYLVINKPAGVLTHPTPKREKDTIADWATSHYPAIAKVGDDPWRPGIVHRLDRDVSGVMVLPKNYDGFEHLKEQFQNRTVVKKYVCLVHGQTDEEKDHLIIDAPIGRSSRRPGLMAAHPRKGIKTRYDKDKAAKTEYWVQQKYKRFTYLLVQPHTGRMHQIRVHLKSIGHPIAGDPLYRMAQYKQDKKLERIFLHAQELTFENRDGKKMTFQADLPNELEQYLTKLEK